MKTDRLIRNLILPAIGPVLLIWLYFTPKSVFGCANRGYMALAVVFLSLIGALATTVRMLMAKRHGDIEGANWWALTTLILVLPLVLLIGPLR